MSETKTQNSQKDMFNIFQQNVDKMFSSTKQSIPQYHQSITNVQQEYIQSFEGAVSSAITMQKELVKKAGISTNIPEATIKAMRDTADEFIKVASVQNQMTLATIDAAQQNIKMISDGANLFAELNKNMIQSWITAFSTKN